MWLHGKWHPVCTTTTTTIPVAPPRVAASDTSQFSHLLLQLLCWTPACFLRPSKPQLRTKLLHKLPGSIVLLRSEAMRIQLIPDVILLASMLCTKEDSGPFFLSFFLFSPTTKGYQLIASLNPLVIFSFNLGRLVTKRRGSHSRDTKCSSPEGSKASTAWWKPIIALSLPILRVSIYPPPHPPGGKGKDIILFMSRFRNKSLSSLVLLYGTGKHDRR